MIISELDFIYDRKLGSLIGGDEGVQSSYADSYTNNGGDIEVEIAGLGEVFNESLRFDGDGPFHLGIIIPAHLLLL